VRERERERGRERGGGVGGGWKERNLDVASDGSALQQLVRREGFRCIT
jgi:hypothetical protein